jgi:microcystin-dependent protein
MTSKARNIPRCAALAFATGLGVFACLGGGPARAQDKLDRIDRELKELQQRSRTLVAVPVGTVMAYTGDVADRQNVQALRRQGWLPCDGAEHSAADFKDLYNVIGTTFGGNKDMGRFNVPDLRGRFLRGTDQGSGNDPDASTRMPSAPGGNSGDRVGTKQDDALGSHAHTLYAAHGSSGGRSSGDPVALAGWPDAGHAATKAVDAAGGRETRPKNVAVNWIIKAMAVLPAAP